eukprot:COSAG01_NODE_42625_length_438_cov_0.719764_1_plen_40_part_10
MIPPKKRFEGYRYLLSVYSDYKRLVRCCRYSLLPVLATGC